MELSEVIERRQSVRSYSSQPVEPEKLEEILKAANAAPSAANLQAYEIYVVTKVRQRAALAQAAGGQGFVLAAPVVLVFCGNPARNQERFGDRGRLLYTIQDATIACAYAQLAATAGGLASCWVGAFDEGAVRHAIELPAELRPLALLPVGYAAGPAETRERRTLADLVHRMS
jgi:nitroreductase